MQRDFFPLDNIEKNNMIQIGFSQTSSDCTASNHKSSNLVTNKSFLIFIASDPYKLCGLFGGLLIDPIDTFAIAGFKTSLVSTIVHIGNSGFVSYRAGKARVIKSHDISPVSS